MADYKWFGNVAFDTPIDDIKRMYLRLCKEHHPDLGGSTEDMAEINAEYERLQRHHYNIHRNRDGEVYTDERQDAPTETAGEFMAWVVAFLKMGLNVEVCGSWLWLTDGTETTKAHKDELKAMGCYFSGNKRCWYMHPKEAPRRKWHHKALQMDEIRDRYGSAYFKASQSKDQMASV